MKAFSSVRSLRNYETYLHYGVYFTVIGLLIQALGILVEKWTVMKLGYLFLIIGFMLLVIPLYLIFKGPQGKIRSVLKK